MKVKINLRMVVLLLLAALAGTGFAALQMYSMGQRDAITVEIRAQAISGGLSLYKRELGALPASLELLAPKYIPKLGKCPDGAAFQYNQLDEGEYQLACAPLFFGAKPYRYNSRSRSWTGD